MKTESTYQKILKHIKPKRYAMISSRIDEIEQLIREAHTLLTEYKDSQNKTIEDYQRVIFAIEKFRRDKWSPYPQAGSIGMYDKLLEDTTLEIKSAMKQLHKKLSNDGINVEDMIRQATTIGEFGKYAEWFVSYNARKGNKANVTLDDYRKAKDVQSMIENAGNSGISSIIIPMKNALEPYKLTLFDVLKFSDPDAEKQYSRAKSFEGSVDLEIKKQANRKYIATHTPNTTLLDPNGGRSIVVGDAPHHIEDAYEKAYSSMSAMAQTKLKEIYSLSIAQLNTYVYPSVSTFTQNMIDGIDCPTNN